MHTLQQLRSGELKGISRLKLTCGLTTFPEEIFDLSDSLEILDLSGNKLQVLPAEFARLHKLKIVFFSDNLFTEYPEVLAECKALEMVGFKANQIRKIPVNALAENLRWLILTDNQLTEIPAGIGRCLRLQKLMLAGNKLAALPQEMATCKNLELLRISANNFSEIPAWLLDMPRLAWLAIAGNPATKMLEMNTALPEIPWREFNLQHQLGEGASGIITKATWQKPAENNAQAVAVKVFKGHVTSDGFPADEMQVCIAAGEHPNLVKVIGKIGQHPQQRQGLVLELIPPDFRNLAGPPSFETCTRDTFPAGTDFSETAVLKIATGIASAAAHLHNLGIMHGDLYAHNILINAAADSLFGDFGAASMYNRDDINTTQKLERLEVRAFGYLLDDLLINLNPKEKNGKIVSELAALREACLSPVVTHRPDFSTISGILRVLLAETS